MKKIYLLLIILLVLACEKDDFCSQEIVTPKLNIKFMNFQNLDSLKETNNLNVWVNEKDSLYKNAIIDSISIPLNSTTNNTQYNFSIANDSINILDIKYTTSHEFVSRSCGFKVNFHDLEITSKSVKNSWIDSISVKNIPTLINQTNAHIIIYH